MNPVHIRPARNQSFHLLLINWIFAKSIIQLLSQTLLVLVCRGHANGSGLQNQTTIRSIQTVSNLENTYRLNVNADENQAYPPAVAEGKRGEEVRRNVRSASLPRSE